MTAQPIQPRDLAEHALHLAQYRPRDGRSPASWLRRSTSASYYAVFHAVALAVAAHVAPSSAAEDRLRLARSVDHGRTAEVCAWLAGTRGDGREQVRPIVRRLRANAELVHFARTFIGLQEARHDADYDHLALVGRRGSLDHHTRALIAMYLLERLIATPDGQELLALVALHTSLR
jgi:hypothetical protein